jgi:hypothetical protein
MSQEEIDLKINSKEKSRYFNDLNLEEPLYEPFNEIRVRPLKINYPDLRN